MKVESIIAENGKEAVNKFSKFMREGYVAIIIELIEFIECYLI